MTIPGRKINSTMPSSVQPSPTPVLKELSSHDTEQIITNDSPQTSNTSPVTSAHDSGVKGKRKRTDKDKEAAKRRRINQRVNKPPTDRHPRRKQFADPPTMITSLDCPVDMPVESTGFAGKKSVPLKPGEHWTVDELMGLGFEEIAWDGK